MLQLLRHSPPGYGGVERVAHELAEYWYSQGKDSTIYSLLAPSSNFPSNDLLTVSYERVTLPGCTFGRLVVPFPGRELLHLIFSTEPLHVHLPCPTSLAIAMIARLFRPCRLVSVHWHSFLQTAPSITGLLYGLYECIAELLVRSFDRIVTTSPVLYHELIAIGAAPRSVKVLACSLPKMFECLAGPVAASHDKRSSTNEFRLICIGRLDSYKRVDWLIDALFEAQVQLSIYGILLHLDVVGDGPKREALGRQLYKYNPAQVTFHGIVDESAKLMLLAKADLLVLSSSSSNEAFGIAQLEAMACAVPAVAFNCPRSGMFWVSKNHAFPWDGRRQSLPSLIQHLATDFSLLTRSRFAARQRYIEIFSREQWFLRVEEAFQL